MKFVTHLFSKKKECNNTLCEWQTSFANSLKKGHYFFNFEDKKERVIKPTYAKEGLWLPIIGFTNSLCARFTCMTTGHAPLESTDSDSSLTSPPVAPVVKPRFKPENTLSWNAIGMTPPHNHATPSSTALFTFLRTTPKHLALIMDKVPLRRSSLEQKHSPHHLVSFTHPSPPFFFFLFLFFPFLSL